MSKINSTLHKKLILQAEEAKELSLNKLADAILSSIGSVPRDNNEEFVYSYSDLKKDIHNNLWKVALDIIAYHDLKSLDSQKIDQVVSELSDKITSDIETSLNVSDKFGPFESKLPGESK